MIMIYDLWFLNMYTAVHIFTLFYIFVFVATSCLPNNKLMHKMTEQDNQKILTYHNTHKQEFRQCRNVMYGQSQTMIYFWLLIPSRPKLWTENALLMGKFTILDEIHSTTWMLSLRNERVSKGTACCISLLLGRLDLWYIATSDIMVWFIFLSIISHFLCININIVHFYLIYFILHTSEKWCVAFAGPFSVPYFPIFH